MAIFFPAYIFLIFSKGKGQSLYKRFTIFFIAVSTLAIVAGSILFIKEYTTNLYFENIFLPLFTGKPIDPAYSIISLPHLVDIVNQMMLMSPAIFMLIAIAAAEMPKIIKDKLIIFLGIAALAGLTFLFVIDPTIGMPRDWDLLSITIYGAVLAIVYLIGNKALRMIQTLLIPLLVCVGLWSMPYLLTNLSEPASINYAKYIINLDMENSLSALLGLREYYKIHSDSAAVDSINNILNTTNPNQLKVDRAISLLAGGNMKEAQAIALTVTPDKFSSRYHDLISAIYFVNKEYDKAFHESDKAIQLQKYNYQLYFARAVMHRMLSENQDALEALRIAHRLNKKNVDVLHELTIMCFNINMNDSAIHYGQKILELDSTSYNIHYIMARIYFQAGQHSIGMRYYELYLKYGTHEPLFTQRNDELLKLMAK
jgi:Tfp pilus assembly protein PilF